MKIKIGDYKNRKGIPDLDIELSEQDCAKAYGLSLKRLRKLNKISLDKLSEKIGVSNPSMNRYENGYNLPSIYNAYKIAYYFDTTIESMIHCGIFEMDDMSKGIDTKKGRYIETWVGIGEKVSKVLDNKTTIKFQDHQKPKKTHSASRCK